MLLKFLSTKSQSITPISSCSIQRFSVILVLLKPMNENSKRSINDLEKSMNSNLVVPHWYLKEGVCMLALNAIDGINGTIYAKG